MNKRSLLYLILMCVFAITPALATPAGCNTFFGTNVLAASLIPGCSFGNLVFDQFSVVSAPPGSTIFLSSIGSAVVPSGVNLGFQITTPTPPVDTIFQYRITGYTNGVDNAHNASGSGKIQEIVCSVPFAGGICPTGFVLANFVNPPTNIAFYAPQQVVYILKDISLPDTNSFISSFVNSAEVPEPSTIGLALFGLAAISSRFRRR